MVKGRESKTLPSIEQIMQAYGWSHDRNNGARFYVKERSIVNFQGETTIITRPCKNIQEVARALKATSHQVRRVIKLAKTGKRANAEA